MQYIVVFLTWFNKDIFLNFNLSFFTIGYLYVLLTLYLYLGCSSELA